MSFCFYIILLVYDIRFCDARYSSAVDQYLQRPVAIKKLDRPFENSEFAKRTYRELAILSQMDHENVCLLTCHVFFLKG